MNWERFAGNIDSAFFFVVDKIIALMDFFISQARNIGAVALLIAVLSAGLNYALTGQGLKENAVKILKATLFFLIAIAFYPRIVSFISSYAFQLAEGSVYPSVKSHFDGIVRDIEYVDYSSATGRTLKTYQIIEKESNGELFSNLTKTRTVRTGQGNSSGRMTYTSFAPAAVAQIMFFVASECFDYADKNDGGLMNLGQSIVNGLKGLLCGFFIIFTGVFALLEYLICFLEFMLVACVGVILFPLSIWEGSKFMSEKFIGALAGFFIKLLFCNIAVFLLLYGFISMLSVFQSTGFQGTPDQFIFIAFTCLLFFYICKSAPGIAQGLLTGTPSLSATGAISAAAGAVAAAGTARQYLGKAAGTAEKAMIGGAGSVAGGVSAGIAAFGAARGKGANIQTQIASAVFGGVGSVAKDAGTAAGKGALGLTRSLLGVSGGVAGGMSEADENKNKTLGKRFADKKDQGAERGQKLGNSAYA